MELKVYVKIKIFLNMIRGLATSDKTSEIRDAIDLIFACSNFLTKK